MTVGSSKEKSQNVSKNTRRRKRKKEKILECLKSFYRNQVLFKWNLKPYYLQASVIKKKFYINFISKGS